jgi:hypothetical protein
MSADVSVVQTPISVIVAVVAAVGAVVSPLIMAVLVNRNARQMKSDDYARQDLVAARLNARQDESERKAAEVAAQAAEAAALLVESNLKQEEIAKVQGAKLDQIHTLVNSNLTAAMQDQLDTRQANLVLLNQAVHARAADGLPVDTTATDTIAATKVKIAELSAQLLDRKKQTIEAQRQLEVDIARKV